MKKYISIISFLLLSFFYGFAQSIDCTIKFIDRENTDMLLYHILIDDSIYVSPNLGSILENNNDIYKFSINEGEHRISATMEGYSLIDTTLIISQTNNNFTLTIDMNKYDGFIEDKYVGVNP